MPPPTRCAFTDFSYRTTSSRWAHARSTHSSVGSATVRATPCSAYHFKTNKTHALNFRAILAQVAVFPPCQPPDDPHHRRPASSPLHPIRGLIGPQCATLRGSGLAQSVFSRTGAAPSLGASPCGSCAAPVREKMLYIIVRQYSGSSPGRAGRGMGPNHIPNQELENLRLLSLILRR
jgi:hypothetical protein